MATSRKSTKRSGDDHANNATDQEDVCTCCPEHRFQLLDALLMTPRHWDYERVFSVAAYLKFIAGAVAIGLWIYCAMLVFVEYIAPIVSPHSGLAFSPVCAFMRGVITYTYSVFMFGIIPGTAVWKFLMS